MMRIGIELNNNMLFLLCDLDLMFKSIIGIDTSSHSLS